MSSKRLLLAALLALSSALGCGPEFDPGNELKGLRVLGVKKDKPYAQPGDDVNLQLLWHDAKGRDESKIQRVFIGGCINPSGDLYYGCFPQFAQKAATGMLPFSPAGDTFQVSLPTDIVSGRSSFQPGQPHYGLYIVFFAVCAGRIQLAMDAPTSSDGSTGLPISCLDENDQPLGSDDFVVGYSSIYSFDNVSNDNPSFTVDTAGKGEFLIADKPVPADCVGDACQGAPPVTVDCAQEPNRCIKACADDGDPGCPTIDVKPAIDKIIETDQVSTDLFGTPTTEQMWVNYYIDHGSISEVRLLNDTNSGWNEKYRGQLRAPKDTGPLQVWAVAHDNRGGMEFTRVTLKVE